MPVAPDQDAGSPPPGGPLGAPSWSRPRSHFGLEFRGQDSSTVSSLYPPGASVCSSVLVFSSKWSYDVHTVSRPLPPAARGDDFRVGAPSSAPDHFRVGARSSTPSRSAAGRWSVLGGAAIRILRGSVSLCTVLKIYPVNICAGRVAFAIPPGTGRLGWPWRGGVLAGAAAGARVAERRMLAPLPFASWTSSSAGVNYWEAPGSARAGTLGPARGAGSP